jgi:hypothetical protein
MSELLLHQERAALKSFDRAMRLRALGMVFAASVGGGLTACGGGVSEKVAPPAVSATPTSPVAAPGASAAASSPTVSPVPPPVSVPVPSPASPLQQAVEYASAAYRATKVLDGHMRVVARLGGNMIVDQASRSLPSYSNQTLSCSKSGTYVSSFVKGSGANASLGWAAGDALTISYNECRWDDNRRLHGTIRVTANQALASVSAVPNGTRLLYLVTVSNFAVPFDDNSDALATGTVNFNTILNDATSITMSYTGSRGYDVQLFNKSGAQTDRVILMGDVAGQGVRSAFSEWQSVQGDLRYQRLGAPTYDFTTVSGPGLTRSTAPTWQTEAGSGSLKIINLAAAPSATVVMTANDVNSIVTLDRNSTGVISDTATTTMAVMAGTAPMPTFASASNPPTTTSTTTVTGTVTAPTPSPSASSPTATPALTINLAKRYTAQAYSFASFANESMVELAKQSSELVINFGNTILPNDVTTTIPCEIGAQRVTLRRALAATPGWTVGDELTIDYEGCFNASWPSRSLQGTQRIRIGQTNLNPRPGSKLVYTVINSNPLLPNTNMGFRGDAALEVDTTASGLLVVTYTLTPGFELGRLSQTGVPTANMAFATGGSGQSSLNAGVAQAFSLNARVSWSQRQARYYQEARIQVSPSFVQSLLPGALPHPTSGALRLTDYKVIPYSPSPFEIPIDSGAAIMTVSFSGSTVTTTIDSNGDGFVDSRRNELWAEYMTDTTSQDGIASLANDNFTDDQAVRTAAMGYRYSSAVSKHVYQFARYGALLYAQTAAQPKASFANAVVTCGVSGDYLMTIAKSSGATETLGWAVGDSLTLQYRNCTENWGETIRINGTMKVTAQQNLTAAPDGTRLLFRLEGTNFAIPAGAASRSIGTGQMDVIALFSNQQASLQVAYSLASGYTVGFHNGDLVATDTATAVGVMSGTAVFLTGNAEARSMDGRLTTAIPGGGSTTFRIVVNPAFNRGLSANNFQSQPSSGSMQLSGFAGASSAVLTLTALNSGARVDIDRNGDGLPEASVNTTIDAMATAPDGSNAIGRARSRIESLTSKLVNWF